MTYIEGIEAFVKLLRTASADDLLMRAARIIEAQAQDVEKLKAVPGHASWSCGHVATAVCGMCHAELIQRANRLAAENLELRERSGK